MSTQPNGATSEADFQHTQGIINRMEEKFHSLILQAAKQGVSEHFASQDVNERIRLEVERQIVKQAEQVPQLVSGLLPLQVEHAVDLWMKENIGPLIAKSVQLYMATEDDKPIKFVRKPKLKAKRRK